MSNIEVKVGKLEQENIAQNDLLEKLFEGQEKIIEKLDKVSDKADRHEEKDQKRNEDVLRLIREMRNESDSKYVSVKEMKAVKWAFGVAWAVLSFLAGYFSLKQ